MAPMSRGYSGGKKKVADARRHKGASASTANHRFETFTQRLAKLKIDPVRRARDVADSEDIKSHFKSTFEEWRESNLSENFTAFSKKVDPLCHSLPQILHHREQIFALLVEHLSKRDVVSLEPLLSLTAQFAHDLGSRFEEFFSPAVETIRDIASSHEDVEVIEWSFNCLAWLFKYLSRLLVPDLRPLFTLMAPLLGKTKQRYFVSRFAAEAMAFLMRKAAARYEKDSQPLDSVIDAVLKDLVECADERREQYMEGLIYLFADSVAGVQQGVSTVGPIVLKSLIAQVRLAANPVATTSAGSPRLGLVSGVLTMTIHHTNPTGFKPILDAVFDSMTFNGIAHDLDLTMQLMLTVTASRKGSRISDWPSVFEKASLALEALKTVYDSAEIIPTSLKLLAALIQYSPPNLLIGRIQQLLQQATSPPLETYFVDFCVLCAELGKERFDSHLKERLEEHIISKWSENEARFCLTVRSLTSSGIVDSFVLKSSPAWCRRIISEFEELSAGSMNYDGNLSHRLLSCCNSYLDLIQSMSLSEDLEIRVSASLLHLVRQQLKSTKDSLIRRFALGRVLLWLASRNKLDQSDLGGVLRASESMSPSCTYLQALTAVLKSSNFGVTEDDLQQYLSHILRNLSSPSRLLRLASLELLQRIHARIHNQESNALATCMEIEQSPPTVERSRALAMSIRRLGLMYQEAQSDSILDRALPSYCFGILHIRLAPLWDETTSALQAMCSSKPAEEFIAAKAVEWLNMGVDDTSIADTNDSDSKPARVFAQEHQDHNTLTLEQKAARVLVHDKSSDAELGDLLLQDNTLEVMSSSLNRSQGLRIFNKLPQLAERKSRVLVPILLGWIDADPSDDLEEIDLPSESDTLDSDQIAQLPIRSIWGRKDKIALLSVFAQFVNPGVLYKSDEVHQGLLTLLCNGDVEIQRSALKAIFTWKSSSIRPYEEHLLNLLDDVKFRDELSTFLNVDDDDSEVQLQHRAALRPILLRLLYGRTVARGKTSNAMRSQDGRRKAVLLSLARHQDGDLDEFLSIALGPLHDLRLLQNGVFNDSKMDGELLTPRKQLGIINMIKDSLTTLAHDLRPFAGNLLDATLYCLIRSSRQLQSQSQQFQPLDTSLLRSLRQEGLHCLILLTTSCPDFDWSPYSQTILDNLVSPRLVLLPTEMSQGISSLFKLFGAWSLFVETIDSLLLPNYALLETLADTLTIQPGRDEVKIYVLNDIFRRAIEVSNMASKDVMDADSEPKKSLTDRFPTLLVERWLDRILTLIQSTPSRSCMEACVAAVVSLQPFTGSMKNLGSLLEISSMLLNQPVRIISPKLKGEVLRVLQAIVPTQSFAVQSEDYQTLVTILSNLFSYFKDIPNRQRLVDVFTQLTSNDSELRDIAQLCGNLNAISKTRATEPDFDVRLDALNQINSGFSVSLNARQWRPLVQTLLFLVHDDEELAMRTSSSIALRRFIQAACTTQESREEMYDLVQGSVLAAAQKGMRDPSELIRAEYLAILVEAVRLDWSSVSDMQILLGPDDEASVLGNILHIQHHRRGRAIRRLGVMASSLSVNNIWRYCIPLVDNFLSVNDDNDHPLANEAINVLEDLSKALDWSHYRQFLQQKLDEASKFDSRLRIRIFGSVVNALHTATGGSSASKDLDGSDAPMQVHKAKLAETMPESAGLAQALSLKVLPRLMECIHFRDEASVELRVMAASIAVKLFLCLSTEEMAFRLPTVLIDVSNVLRSRAQDTRDTTRKTLAEIALLIGIPYFGFILKQLRTALQRGYQLHVLGYTVHSLLVTLSPILKPGDLDYYVPEILKVLVDDIFGAVGVEKESEDYVSKMKEVRSKNHSFDSMEIIATLSSVELIPALLAPLREQLRMHRPRFEKIEELFRRLREGLRRNSQIDDQKTLIICFQLAAAAQNDDRGAGRPGTYRIMAFAFDLLRRVLDKHEQLKTPENLAGFMPIIEQAMKQSEEEVQLSVSRLLTSIIKVQMPVLDERAAEYMKQAKKLIEASASTGTPVAQAALRLTAAVLRDRPYAVVKQSFFENHIAYLLKRVRPDLQEPGKSGEREHQVAAFNLLRAIIGRGVMFPEVYEVMETVREVMITSGQDPIPNLSRSVYSRFVLDYFPEGGKGFSKQVDFLVKNLQYPNPRGRQSVMDVLMFLMTKKDGEALQAFLLTIFLPLVLVLAADENKECQMAAGLVLQKIFERADKEKLKTIRSQLQKWIQPESDLSWQRIGFLCWKHYFTAHQTAEQEARNVLIAVSNTIETAEGKLKGEHAALLDASLNLLQTMVDKFPSVTFAGEREDMWTTIIELVRSNRHIVRLSSAQLLNTYLVHFARHASDTGIELLLPITGSDGLSLDTEDATAIIEGHTTALKQADLDQATSDLLVQNLAFIGMACGANDSTQVGASLLKHVTAVVRNEGDVSLLKAKAAALKLMESLCRNMAVETLEASLHSVLLGLVILTDKAVTRIQDSSQEELTTKAHELLGMIQDRLGAEKFLPAIQEVQKEVRERREERRAKRRVEAISDPEKAGREKARRHAKTKQKRKDKNHMHAMRRKGY